MDDLDRLNGKMSGLVTALVSTCFTLVALMPVAYIAYKKLPPPLVAIDVQKIVEEDQSRLMDYIGAASGTVSEEKRAIGERMTADFAQRLSMNVELLSAECHCVLINKAALLSGTAVDYTDMLKERMKK